jgi:hypothetical protein|tara:strand:- start:747 stop:947 length:201 start_codon:yes stop_codon:yes gene_type:complete
MSRRSTDRARPREHPLCSFAACVPPKDLDETRVRCVSTSTRTGDRDARAQRIARLTTDDDARLFPR